MLLLLQTMQTLWNWALGADIIGTIFFFFIARNDNYSAVIVFINVLCFFSNLLWAKMFSDLQRNQRTIYFFLVLAALAVIGTIFAWRAPVDESEEDEYEYEYYSSSEDEDDDVDEKNAKKMNELINERANNNNKKKKNKNRNKKKNN